MTSIQTCDFWWQCIWTSFMFVIFSFQEEFELLMYSRTLYSSWNLRLLSRVNLLIYLLILRHFYVHWWSSTSFLLNTQFFNRIRLIQILTLGILMCCPKLHLFLWKAVWVYNDVLRSTTGCLGKACKLICWATRPNTWRRACSSDKNLSLSNWVLSTLIMVCRCYRPLRLKRIWLDTIHYILASHIQLLLWFGRIELLLLVYSCFLYIVIRLMNLISIA